MVFNLDTNIKEDDAYIDHEAQYFDDVAYIETANIDGESNLKVKVAASTGIKPPTGIDDNSRRSFVLQKLVRCPMNFVTHNIPTLISFLLSKLSLKSLSVQCEQPNSNIHHFHGMVFANGREMGLDASSLLLRGSSLRNTKWILGIVVYTGSDIVNVLLRYLNSQIFQDVKQNWS
jgi:magnesium-transporting ATPase (P-type)